MVISAHKEVMEVADSRKPSGAIVGQPGRGKLYWPPRLIDAGERAPFHGLTKLSGPVFIHSEASVSPDPD